MFQFRSVFRLVHYLPLLPHDFHNRIDILYALSSEIKIVQKYVRVNWICSNVCILGVPRNRGKASKSRLQQGPVHLRWARFRDSEHLHKFEVFSDEVFPFIKSLNGRAGSSYTRFMKDAVLIIPSPALLDKVVNMIDAILMEYRDTERVINKDTDTEVVKEALRAGCYKCRLFLKRARLKLRASEQ